MAKYEGNSLSTTERAGNSLSTTERAGNSLSTTERAGNNIDLDHVFSDKNCIRNSNKSNELTTLQNYKTLVMLSFGEVIVLGLIFLIIMANYSTDTVSMIVFSSVYVIIQLSIIISYTMCRTNIMKEYNGYDDILKSNRLRCVVCIVIYLIIVTPFALLPLFLNSSDDSSSDTSSDTSSDLTSAINMSVLMFNVFAAGGIVIMCGAYMFKTMSELEEKQFDLESSVLLVNKKVEFTSK
jgi:hypothetical protein